LSKYYGYETDLKRLFAIIHIDSAEASFKFSRSGGTVPRVKTNRNTTRGEYRMLKIVELAAGELALVAGGDPDGGSSGIPSCIPPLPGENFLNDLLRQIGQVGN
jgi:hypothetical protein